MGGGGVCVCVRGVRFKAVQRTHVHHAGAAGHEELARPAACFDEERRARSRGRTSRQCPQGGQSSCSAHAQGWAAAGGLHPGCRPGRPARSLGAAQGGGPPAQMKIMSGLNLTRAGMILSRQERRQSATLGPNPGMPMSMTRGPSTGGTWPPAARGGGVAVVFFVLFSLNGEGGWRVGGGGSRQRELGGLVGPRLAEERQRDAPLDGQHIGAPPRLAGQGSAACGCGQLVSQNWTQRNKERKSRA